MLNIFENVVDQSMQPFRLSQEEPKVQQVSGIDFDNINFESESQMEESLFENTQGTREEIDFESTGPITFGISKEPGIYQAPEPEEKSWAGKVWEGVLKAVKDDEAKKIKSANAAAMAESFGISPSKA